MKGSQPLRIASGILLATAIFGLLSLIMLFIEEGPSPFLLRNYLPGTLHALALIVLSVAAFADSSKVAAAGGIALALSRITWFAMVAPFTIRHAYGIEAALPLLENLVIVCGGCLLIPLGFGHQQKAAYRILPMAFFCTALVIDLGLYCGDTLSYIYYSDPTPEVFLYSASLLALNLFAPLGCILLPLSFSMGAPSACDRDVNLINSTSANQSRIVSHPTISALDMQRYMHLRDEGILTHEEFTAIKERYLKSI